MVVDTSALTAILTGEPERDLFEDLILRTPTVVMSVAAVVETSIVLRSKRRDPQADLLDELLTELGIDVRPFDGRQGALARDAFKAFGKGRHPARLNFGDCLTYALAKGRDDTLLFKGDDFARTDIPPAWQAGS
jgi:ribonuclease VapC